TVRASAQPGRNARRWVSPDEREEHEELALVFAKFDRLAMGVAGGAVAAALIMVLTLFLVIKGGPVIGPNLALLRQYFPGYRVTLGGAFIGAVYAFVVGGVLGWTAAAIRNVAMFLYWIVVRRRAEHLALRQFLEIV
ncbi:MAG TPA: hypothetical protein VH518_09730, partial [Tepidisphaeraceae bacterium]